MLYLIYEVVSFLIVGVCIVADIDDKFPQLLPHVIAFGRWLWRKPNHLFLATSEERDRLRALAKLSRPERQALAKREALQDMKEEGLTPYLLLMEEWSR